jgi:hypothetical protein
MIVNKHYLRNETSCAFTDSFFAPQAISMVMYRIVKLKKYVSLFLKPFLIVKIVRVVMIVNKHYLRNRDFLCILY